MDERYGKEFSQSIEDVQWIPDAVEAGDAILCKDLRIASNPLEAQCVYMHQARAFGLRNARITGPEMVKMILGTGPKIFQMARKEGPYVMAIVDGRLSRKKLAYPP